MRLKRITFFLAGFGFLFAVIASAQEMRSLNPITAPGPLPEGAQSVAVPAPLNPQQVRTNVEQAFSKWNAGDTGALLSDNFYDKERFTDAMFTNVPRDAKLKIVGVGGVQTFNQMIVPDQAGGKKKVTTGSVMVNSQIEFNDPTNGFVRVPGTNEIIFEMIEKIE